MIKYNKIYKHKQKEIVIKTMLYTLFINNLPNKNKVYYMVYLMSINNIEMQYNIQLRVICQYKIT